MTDSEQQEPTEIDQVESADGADPAESSESGDVSARKPMAAAYTPAPSTEQDGKSVAAKKTTRRPAKKAAAKPAARKPMKTGLSAADYERTTKDEASSTAVIPAVKDSDDGPKAPAPRRPRKPRPDSGKSASTEIEAVPVAKGPGFVEAEVINPVPAIPAGAAGPMVVLDEGQQSSEHPTRRAAVRVSYVDPWSVTRMAFVVSVALMIVSVVAAAVVWVVLSLTGVWSAINDSVTNVLSDDSTGFRIGNFLGFGRLVGFTLMASALNVVFFTALATICAHLYNLAAGIMGGFKVTLSDD